MARIRNANPKSSSGGYTRVFDNKQLGDLIQKVQSTVITNGNELENMICDRATLITDLDKFIRDSEENSMAPGSYLCTKKVVKKSSYKLDKHEPDFLIFILSDTKKICFIIELKDGDSFDTKKSDAEKNSLQVFQNHLGSKIPFITKYYLCSFNQPNKDMIVSGFKNRFTEDEVLTGEEFCRHLNINYSDIVETRKSDAPDNRDYFIDQILSIPLVMQAVKSKYGNHIAENDFYISENSDE